MALRHIGRAVATWRKRVALRRLWWRHTYTFNLAHKPLCARFAHDVLRVGRVYVCRSCLLACAGAVFTGLGLLCVGLPERRWLPVFYGSLAAVMVLSYPPVYGLLHRLGRDVVRCGAGAVLALMATFFVAGHVGLGLLNVAVFAIGYLASRGAYRRWKLDACDGCPEVGRGQVCSGYLRQADRIRAYESAAEDYLFRTGRFDTPGHQGGQR
jgi:hypothetical protein